VPKAPEAAPTPALPGVESPAQAQPAVPAPPVAREWTRVAAETVRPEPLQPSAIAHDGARPRRDDASLTILEDEAAREALRRRLVPPRPSSGGRPGDEPDTHAAAPRDTDPDAERHQLSDELLVDHLSADVYRTTGFSRDQDAVGETRTAALSLVRSLTPQERESLLRSALEGGAAAVQPLYEAVPRELR
jgi:hypothetical protein